MTDEQMCDLVKECGLDWQRGYMPLFDGDATIRYAVLIEAALAPERESRLMFVARLENMQTNGDKWLTTEAVLALLNDCDMLASRERA